MNILCCGKCDRSVKFCGFGKIKKVSKFSTHEFKTVLGTIYLEQGDMQTDESIDFDNSPKKQKQLLKSRFVQLQGEYRNLLAVTSELTNALQLNIVSQAKNVDLVLDQCKTIYPSLFQTPRNEQDINKDKSKETENIDKTTERSSDIIPDDTEVRKDRYTETFAIPSLQMPNSDFSADETQEVFLHKNPPLTPLSHKEVKDIVETVLNRAIYFLNENDENNADNCCCHERACRECTDEISSMLRKLLHKVMASPRGESSISKDNSPIPHNPLKNEDIFESKNTHTQEEHIGCIDNDNARDATVNNYNSELAMMAEKRIIVESKGPNRPHSADLSKRHNTSRSKRCSTCYDCSKGIPSEKSWPVSISKVKSLGDTQEKRGKPLDTSQVMAPAICEQYDSDRCNSKDNSPAATKIPHTSLETEKDHGNFNLNNTNTHDEEKGYAVDVENNKRTNISPSDSTMLAQKEIYLESKCSNRPRSTNLPKILETTENIRCSTCSRPKEIQFVPNSSSGSDLTSKAKVMDNTQLEKCEKPLEIFLKDNTSAGMVNSTDVHKTENTPAFQRKTVRPIQQFVKFQTPLCYMEMCRKIQDGNSNCRCANCVPGKNRYYCGCYDLICRELAEEIGDIDKERTCQKINFFKKLYNHEEIARPKILEHYICERRCSVCGDAVCKCAFESRPRIRRTPPE
ncbi:hypothetical protein JTB14_017651 [Gonioctena quinquepunctata]|nr:hypothetical protein JTB14_017651 [Gonioctena quinquepunctata]